MVNNNYLLAFLLCIACTVLAALNNNSNLQWLVMSDINVAIWLWIAWLLDGRR